MHLSIAQVLLVAASFFSQHVYSKPIITTGAVSKADPPSSTIATLRAFGIGVSSRAAASEWYARNLGVQYLIGLPASLYGYNSYAPFDENIGYLGTKGIALVFMEWRQTPSRSVKNLPVLLQFTVPDVKAAQAKVLAGGGSAWDGSATSTGRQGALYAKDPDGYMLEFIQTDESTRSNTTSLSSVGIGVADLSKTSAWFSKTMGASAAAVSRSQAWDSVALNGTEGCELAFMDWHETPRRATFDLPIKLVMLSWSPGDYLSAITRAGGKTLWSLWFAAFAESPDDKLLVEIN